jgi:hypothetical protein
MKMPRKAIPPEPFQDALIFEELRGTTPPLPQRGRGDGGEGLNYFSNSTLTVFGFADSAFGKRTSSTPFL